MIVHIPILVTDLGGSEESEGDGAAVLSQVPEAAPAYHPITKAVSNPRSQGPELVEPIG